MLSVMLSGLVIPGAPAIIAVPVATAVVMLMWPTTWSANPPLPRPRTVTTSRSARPRISSSASLVRRAPLRTPASTTTVPAANAAPGLPQSPPRQVHSSSTMHSG
jgi:hypothetical protein